MQKKQRIRTLLVLLLAMMLAMTGCETLIEILETPFPSAVYVADVQGIARIPYPEQQFTVRLSDPLLLMIPVERSGYYELVNLDHPQTLLYMSIFSMDADRKEPLAENVVADKPTDRFNVQLEGGKSYLVGIGMLGENLTGINVRFQLVTAAEPKDREPVLAKPVQAAVAKPQPKVETPPILTPPDPYLPPVENDIPKFEFEKVEPTTTVVAVSPPPQPIAPPAPATPPEPDKAKLGDPIELKELPPLETEDSIVFTDPVPEIPTARVFPPFADNPAIAEKNVLSGSVEGILTRDGGPYLITSTIAIETGKSLVIEEGTLIRVSNGASIQVQGSLETRGNAGNEVVFTGNNAASPGSWAGIVFHPGSTATLQGTRIIGAGGQQVVNNAWRSGSVFALDGTQLTMDDCEISNGAGPGITLMGRVNPTIRNSSFQNLETPLSLDGTSASPAEFSGNRFASITRMGFEVNAHTLKSGTEMVLQANSLPYIFRDFTIEKGAKLTIFGHNVLKFHPGTGLTVEGTLDVSGDYSKGVVFTSIKDDRGFDSNGDKDASKPQAGDWQGIFFTGEGTGKISGAQILYAGAQRISASAWRSGAVMVGGTADPIIGGCLISDSGYSAVTLFEGARATIQGSTLRNAEWPIVVQDAAALEGLTLIHNIYPKLKYLGIKVEATELKSGKLLTIKPNFSLPYVMNNFTVEKGATLNILGGTLLKFNQGCVLTVRGKLISNTDISNDSIIFTSASSNCNGDSNGDGPNGKPNAGDWGGIVFEGDGTGDFVRTGIHYAGAQKVVNSTWHQGAVTLAGNSQVTFFYSSISNSLDCALNLLDQADVSAEGFNAYFTDWVAKTYSPLAIPSRLDWVYYDDTVKHHAVKLEFSEIPKGMNALIDGEWLPGLVFVSNTLTIQEGGSLTFSMATVKFMPGSQLIVKGQLNAHDDPGYVPTVFTSWNDDFGNDTNGDGSQTKPSAGDWAGLAFTGWAGGTIEMDRIDYAGGQSVVDGAWRKAAFITADRSYPIIRRLMLKNSAGDGFLILGQSNPSIGEQVGGHNIAGEVFKR